MEEESSPWKILRDVGVTDSYSKQGENLSTLTTSVVIRDAVGDRFLWSKQVTSRTSERFCGGCNALMCWVVNSSLLGVVERDSKIPQEPRTTSGE
jgi:hypothetical protein